MDLKNSYRPEYRTPTEADLGARTPNAPPGWPRIPGVVSWLGLLVALVAALAWTRNEQIVVWLLEHELADETAARDLLGAIKVASGIAAVAGLVVAWRIFAWSLLIANRFGPIRALTGPIGSYSARIAARMWTPIADGFRVARAGATSLASVLWRWAVWAGAVVAGAARLGWRTAVTTGRLAGLTFSSLWSAVSAAYAYLHPGISAAGRVTGSAAGATRATAATGLQRVGSGGAAAGRMAGHAFAWIGHVTTATLAFAGAIGTGVISAVARVLAGVSGRAWAYATSAFSLGVRMATAVLGYARPPMAAIAGVLANGLAAVLLFAAVAGRTARSALAGGMARLSSGSSAAGRVTGHGATGMSNGTAVAGGYMWARVIGASIQVRRATLAAAAAGRATLTVARDRVFPALRFAGLAVTLVILVSALAVAHGSRSVARAVRRSVQAIARLAHTGFGSGVATTLRISGPVVAVLQHALRLAWTSLNAVARTAARATGFGLRNAATSVAVVAGYLWRAVSAVAQVAGRNVGLGLRSAATGIATAAGYLWNGTSATTHTAMRPLRSGVGVASHYTATGAGEAGHATGYGLRGVAKSVALVAGYLWSAVSAAAQVAGQIIGLGLRNTATSIATAAGYVSIGTSATTQTAMRPLRSGVDVASHYTATGAGEVGHATGYGLRSAATSAALVAGYLWNVVTAVARLVNAGLRQAGAGVALPVNWLASVLARPVRAGIAATGRMVRAWLVTTGLLAGDAARYGQSGINGIGAGIRIIASRTGRAVATVFTDTAFVAQAGAQAGIRVVSPQKGVVLMTESRVTKGKLLSLVVTVSILFLAVAIPVRVFWPAPPGPTVVVSHWSTGHLTRDGLLPAMAEQFNKVGHRTESGAKIVVEVYNAPSELQAKYLTPRVLTGGRLDLNKITNGYVVKNIPDPTIVTPSSAHWLVSVNYEVGRDVVNLDGAKSIVKPVIGIVTYEEMARCLGWPDKEIGFADIIALRENPDGWNAYSCSKTEWGKTPLLAFTDPTTSSTGRSLHLGLYAIGAGKAPQDLTVDDVSDPNVVAYVKKFQSLIDHYQLGTTVLNTKIYRGPEFGQFFIMPEDNLIHLYEGTEKSFENGIKTTAPPITERMVMIYPKEGSMPRNNCACIVDADWVTEEQVEAAEMWIDYIRRPAQQRAFMASGFRPGTDIRLDDPASKINARFGLDPNQPKVVLNPSLTGSEVAAAIDASWEQVKRPGIVTFVVDTSGSMLGNKLAQARDGMLGPEGALTLIAQNNQVGFVTFSDGVNASVPVAPLAENRFAIADAVREMRAAGGTALYEAIKKGVEMTDAAVGPEDAIRGVVVLTDGRANKCGIRLDQIIRLESNELSVGSYSGCTDDPSRYSPASIYGTDLALNTTNDIQIFYIGIGDDADLDIGRMLAGATGAEYRGAAEEDLAKVLGEYAKYF